MGGNYDASNMPLPSTVRMYHGSDSGSGVITTISQRCSYNVPPLARALGCGLFVTASSRRQPFGDRLNLNFCGAVRHGTIRKFSPSGSQNRGPRQGSSDAPQNYLSQLLNSPLAQLGRINQPTVSLVHEAYPSKLPDIII